MTEIHNDAEFRQKLESLETHVVLPVIRDIDLTDAEQLDAFKWYWEIGLSLERFSKCN